MRNVRFQPPARKDIVNIYLESAERFSAAARTRYEALFDAAFRDLAANPARRAFGEAAMFPKMFSFTTSVTASGAFKGHSEYPSRAISSSFVHTDEEVVILRVLHDSMDIGRHVQVSEDESE